MCIRDRNRINPSSGKKQFHTLDFLEKAKPFVPSDGYAMLSLTTDDLYPGDQWNQVFGWALYTARVGVFSVARHYASFYGQKPDEDEEDWVIYKTVRVMTHETTHMFSLPHCIFYSCGMNGFNSIEEALPRSLELCPVCLRKLQSLLKFDNLKRYE
eukprot:TRINITY_DN5165_c0_g1_i2.p1 TRINITY_DN5165_c0_g1~~TRINITY_DN5165_c0_g1_i2.p1  ORF type:complete len:166 (+),score=18.30 TRINITY_DN5165_c0_g1_i2:33-500(+)